MNLQQRKELLAWLGNYMLSDEEQWKNAKEKAFAQNQWFIPQFIDLSVKNIVQSFLQPQQLQQLADQYKIEEENRTPKKIGIVMAGNIPLVGFHDLLCVFITGNYAMIKTSSKDEALINHLVEKLKQWNAEIEQYIFLCERISNCDAYIATGSTNSSRYFEYYFQKYPAIIRRNRTSVAVLTGNETKEELEGLADDVYQYFGLGCRNVTKIYVPENYDFVPLLTSFKKYDWFIDHNKYKNNYDYNLAMHILNNRFYMTNGNILLVEDEQVFSPISQLHYQYYTDEQQVKKELHSNKNIQCLINKNEVDFGKAQLPALCDFADAVDTVKFLMQMNANK